MSNAKPVPGAKAPPLETETQHGAWRLSDQAPASFTLLVFYRGLHCPICKGQLEEINNKLSALADRGVDAIAISMDDEERWSQTRSKWAIDDLTIGYGLSEADARA